MRSYLFLPGNNPAMLMNADALSSDAMIIDLEDAVFEDQKAAARILMRNAIQALHYAAKVVVRINGLDTQYWRDDLQEAVKAGAAFIMLPKSNAAADVQLLAAEIARLEALSDRAIGSVKIIALIETAVGVVNAFSIASASPSVFAIALGAEDLTADLGCERTEQAEEIQYSRGKLVVDAKAAGVMCIDTPYTDTNNMDGLALDSRRARALGFDAKLIISPRHVDVVNEAFSPSQCEIRYAKEVMEAIEAANRLGKGTVSLHGKMIDKPIVMRAQRVLEQAKQLRCPNEQAAEES